MEPDGGAVISSVCVLSAVPTSRLGLTVALERAGLDVEDPPNVLAWVGSRDRAVVVVIDGADAHRRLRDLRDVPHRSFVLTLLPETDVRSYIEILRHGAGAALPLSASVEDVVDALTAGSRDLSWLPAQVLRALVEGHRSEPPSGSVGPCDRQLLALLAEGRGVASIAKRLHMSERTVHRRRQELFRRLDVSSAAGAVAWAVRHGLLD